jgi:hypothetical protein
MSITGNSRTHGATTAVRGKRRFSRALSDELDFNDNEQPRENYRLCRVGCCMGVW